ncbi:hypothetical protein C8R11_12123 [Nitrosomonas aestuarii]|nr:hypothetical protein C8R11_12123 [Nitrosomonas aestuarii]
MENQAIQSAENARDMNTDIIIANFYRDVQVYET